MSATATALVGFAAWQLVLTVGLAVYRTALVQVGRKPANNFAPDGSDVGAFGQRLTRARDNCYENLPVFAALACGAILAGRTPALDPLAPMCCTRASLSPVSTWPPRACPPCCCASGSIWPRSGSSCCGP